MADYGFSCSEAIQIPIILNISQHNIHQTTILISQVYPISYKKLYYIIIILYHRIVIKEAKIVLLSLKTKLTAILQKI